MADLTHQQLLEAVSDIVQQSEHRIRKDMATKSDINDLSNRIDSLQFKLERKIAASHMANVKHHLETRKMIGDLSHKHDLLREGLAQAVKPT